MDQLCNQKDSAFFTRKELARRWKLSPQTLDRWEWNGTGPKCTRFGRCVRYYYQDVRAYEEQGKVPQGRKRITKKN